MMVVILSLLYIRRNGLCSTNIIKEFTFVFPAASLLPHRFVTVRRGSPAARSGLIRPGDRLESVEGRSVVNLPHRELAQILRRAGNTLRLTVVPRSSARELHVSLNGLET